MREMELFIELIDEREANKILAFFKEIPTGTRKNKATFEQKKNHIKKIFKSSTPNMIRQRRKGAPDPFFTYIKNYKENEIPTENFFQFINYLNELKEMFVYIKYVKLLIHFPEELRENFERIEENIRNGKYPLDFGNNFKNVEDLKNYLRKYRKYIGLNVSENIIKSIEHYHDKEYEKKLIRCKEEIEEFNLLEYYQSFEDLKGRYGTSICNAAYILTHPKEDQDILLLLALESVFVLLQHQKFDALDKLEDKLNRVITEANSEEKEHKRVLNEKTKEVASQKEVIKGLRRNNKQLGEENEKLRENINEKDVYYSNSLKELTMLIEENERKKESIINQYEVKLSTINRKSEFNSLLEIERKEKFKPYYSFSANWGLICLVDYELTKEIYPEILLAKADRKKDIKQLVENPTVEIVYVLMKGLSTRRFKIIKNEIEKSNKIFEAVDFETFKELIEWIGYKKTVERNAVIK
ncbi:hypothetical protein FZC74_16675 [Sutcliffiella horikoshii]|uniref:Uncharacterized protein n=1 Tax=Sutcliffiella horikoshii TaxID=79883 RepID=A0AA94WK88_9BACI|nr:hypothetical protein [Sutcliffiella horikoshii]TYS57325.1 hypothetical protein FZC74_16675 [Sutcliffiella horikoshii]